MRTIKEVEEKGLVAYKYIRGSALYGTMVEGSDVDTSGVYIAPIEDVLGFDDRYQAQVSDEKHDNTYYEIKRWLELLCQSNPNALESLFVPKDKIIGDVHPAIQIILDNRDLFLTKQCFKSFYGYSSEQIKRARGLNKKIVNPVSEKKSVLDFCYVPHRQGSICIKDWLKRYKLKQEYCGLVNIPNMHNMYAVFYDWGAHIANDTDLLDILKYEGIDSFNLSAQFHLHFNHVNEFDNVRYISTNPGAFVINNQKPIGYRGIVTDDSLDVRLSSVKKDEFPICHMSYNKDGYSKHCKDYTEYKKWEKDRNPVRYESNLNKNYDCYLDDETEFLTNNGWKKYDEINETDLIGCFNNAHNIEYLPYKSKYCDMYSGEIYTYNSPYVRFSITPNHKLYISQCHRSPYNNFNTKYDEKTSKWELKRVADYFNGKKSFYHQLTYLNNNKIDNTCYSDDFITLLGLFLSEGTFVFNKKNEIIGIRISQIEGNRCCNVIRNIKTFDIREYKYHKRGKGCELTWECRDKNVIDLVKKCNGRYCTEKDIPNYVYDFSKRQFDILLDAMISGDGSYHKVKGHYVYYTYSKKMAKSLHTLLTLNGYNAQLYGGENGYIYPHHKTNYKRKDGKLNGAYQVFISKFKKQYQCITKTNHWTISTVTNKKIVCFETEYGTIVTRNNNKMAFHGNSKNIMHSVRLMHMAYEIATGQGFNVDRTNIDREFLLNIRNHKFEYDYLINYLEEFKVKMTEAMENSNLPDKVDTDKVNELLIKVRKELC